jgi:alanyl-tRNA synthetase
MSIIPPNTSNYSYKRKHLMATERLYFSDAYLTEFDARIVARGERNGQPAVLLDRSAFYPEGGGQPPDHGTLNGIAVEDVQVEDGDVWHTLAASPDGDTVHGVVDWARRFDHMQQHHGQHMLSAACEQLFQFRTLSFHLGAASSTIDLDTPALTSAQATAIEDRVNQVIWEDRPVQARFVSPEELATMPLRKPPTKAQNVRVVSVPDFDYSACGGTHPRSTGGVGVLHIRRWERRGDTTRVEFLCGRRALNDYRARDALVAQLAADFSVGPDEVSAAVARLRDNEDRGRKQLRAMTEQVISFEAEALTARADMAGIRQVVQQAFEGRELEEVRMLARAIAENNAVALLGLRGERTQIIFAAPASADVDCGALLRAALAPFGGRGGGQRTLAQGGLPDGERLLEVLETARATLSETTK